MEGSSRKHHHRACGPCAAAKRSCPGILPCKRCIAHGKEDMCKVLPDRRTKEYHDIMVTAETAKLPVRQKSDAADGENARRVGKSRHDDGPDRDGFAAGHGHLVGAGPFGSPADAVGDVYDYENSSMRGDNSSGHRSTTGNGGAGSCDDGVHCGSPRDSISGAAASNARAEKQAAAKRRRSMIAANEAVAGSGSSVNYGGSSTPYYAASAVPARTPRPAAPQLQQLHAPSSNVVASSGQHMSQQQQLQQQMLQYQYPSLTFTNSAHSTGNNSNSGSLSARAREQASSCSSLSLPLPPTASSSSSSLSSPPVDMIDLLSRDAILTPAQAEALTRLSMPMGSHSFVSSNGNHNGHSASANVQLSGHRSPLAAAGASSCVYGGRGGAAGAGTCPTEMAGHRHDNEQHGHGLQHADGSSGHHQPDAQELVTIGILRSPIPTLRVQFYPHQQNGGSTPTTGSAPRPPRALANDAWCHLFGVPLHQLQSLVSNNQIPRYVASQDVDRYTAVSHETLVHQRSFQVVTAHFVGAGGKAFRAQETSHIEYEHNQSSRLQQYQQVTGQGAPSSPTAAAGVEVRSITLYYTLLPDHAHHQQHPLAEHAAARIAGDLNNQQQQQARASSTTPAVPIGALTGYGNGMRTTTTPASTAGPAAIPAPAPAAATATSSSSSSAAAAAGAVTSTVNRSIYGGITLPPHLIAKVVPAIDLDQVKPSAATPVPAAPAPMPAPAPSAQHGQASAGQGSRPGQSSQYQFARHSSFGPDIGGNYAAGSVDGASTQPPSVVSGIGSSSATNVSSSSAGRHGGFAFNGIGKPSVQPPPAPPSTSLSLSASAPAQQAPMMAEAAGAYQSAISPTSWVPWALTAAPGGPAAAGHDWGSSNTVNASNGGGFGMPAYLQSHSLQHELARQQRLTGPLDEQRLGMMSRQFSAASAAPAPIDTGAGGSSGGQKGVIVIQEEMMNGLMFGGEAASKLQQQQQQQWSGNINVVGKVQAPGQSSSSSMTLQPRTGGINTDADDLFSSLGMGSIAINTNAGFTNNGSWSPHYGGSSGSAMLTKTAASLSGGQPSPSPLAAALAQSSHQQRANLNRESTATTSVFAGGWSGEMSFGHPQHLQHQVQPQQHHQKFVSIDDDDFLMSLPSSSNTTGGGMPLGSTGTGHATSLSMGMHAPSMMHAFGASRAMHVMDTTRDAFNDVMLQ